MSGAIDRGGSGGSSGDGGDDGGDGGDDGGDGDGGGDPVWENIAPSWIISLGGFGAFGLTIANDGAQAIIAIVVDWIVSSILLIFGEIAIILRDDLFGTMIDALEDAGGAAGEPILGAQTIIRNVVRSLGLEIQSIASTAGPGAPIIAAAMIATIVLGLGAIIRAIIIASPWP